MMSKMEPTCKIASTPVFLRHPFFKYKILIFFQKKNPKKTAETLDANTAVPTLYSKPDTSNVGYTNTIELQCSSTVTSRDLRTNW